MGIEPSEEESPYQLAKRLHASGVTEGDVEKALIARGLSQDEARIAARAGRGEAGFALGVEDPVVERAPSPLDLASQPPAEAPTHPCPVHPAWPVTGTCSRCGKFFCDACVTAAGLTSRPLEKRCPECAEREPTGIAAGLGGWLILPAIHLIISPIQLAMVIVQDLSALAKRTPVVVPVTLELVVQLLHLAFCLFAAVQFFRRKRSAPVTMVVFYVLNIVSAFISAALGAWVLSELHTTNPQDTTALDIGRNVISSLIWIAYFLSSTRVRATFVVD